MIGLIEPFRFETHTRIHMHANSPESLRVLEECSEAGRQEMKAMVERMQRMKDDYVRHKKARCVVGRWDSKQAPLDDLTPPDSHSPPPRAHTRVGTNARITAAV